MDTWTLVSTGTWSHEINGMMRVQDAATARALLQASGNSNGQEPWFVELAGNPESLGLRQTSTAKLNGDMMREVAGMERTGHP